jgi:hypothetical protein
MVRSPRWRDHGISRATGYRYLDEVIEVLANQAPDLHEALQKAKPTGWRMWSWPGRSSPLIAVTRNHERERETG